MDHSSARGGFSVANATTLPRKEMEQTRFRSLELSDASWAIRSDDPHRATELARQALELALKLGEPEARGRAGLALGGALHTLGDYCGALESLWAAERDFARFEGAEQLTALKNLLGVVLVHVGHYDEAVDCYREGLTLARERGERMMEGKLLNNLGDVERHLHDYAAASAHLSEAGSIFFELDRADLAATPMINSAEVRLETGDAAGALETIREAERYTPPGEEPGRLSNLLSVKAMALAALGRHDDAVLAFATAIERAERAANPRRRLRALVRFAAFSLDSDDIVSAVESALTVAESARDLALWPLAAEGYAVLARAYKAYGEWKAACEAMEGRQEAESRMHAEEVDRKVKSIMLQFELESSRRETESLKLKTAELERVITERTCALSRLTSRIAHEINTPVGVSITGATFALETLRRLGHSSTRAQTGSVDGGSDESFCTLEEALTIVVQNLERAAELVADFRMFSSEHAYDEPREYSPLDSVEQALFAAGTDDPRLSLEVMAEPGIVAYGKPGVIASVVRRLFRNSLEHGFSGRDAGRVTIAIGRIHSGVCVRYEDDGVGLLPEVENRVFEPFTTTMRSSGKFGLGLAIVYNTVVSRAGGTISWFRPTRGGLGFLIELPDFPRS